MGRGEYSTRSDFQIHAPARSTRARMSAAIQRCILFCVVLLWCAQARALDPVLDISQYAHTAWRISEGFSASPVTSFAQTQDGYLWLGTGAGLLRFDGVRNRAWQPPAGTSLPNESIRTLFVSK